MKTRADGMSKSSNTAVTTLLARIERVEGLRALYGFGEWTDGWSQCSLVGEASAGVFDTTSLAELAESGCRIELNMEQDRLRVRALAHNSRAFSIESLGEWSDVAQDEQSAIIAADASIRNDLSAMLQAVSPVTFSIVITVFGKELGHSWVRQRKAFVSEYERIGWFRFAQLIAPVDSTWQNVVILDAKDSVLTSREVCVSGPLAVLAEPSALHEVRPDYHAGDIRSNAPLPSSIFPTKMFGSQLADIQSILKTISGNLACLWLADSAIADESTVTIRLEGNRPIQGFVPECPPENAASAVKLWKWTFDATQAGRRHAVLQATTLQINDLDDFFLRSGSILETAQFLFSVAQSGLVQEALAARRAARDAALQAGSAAGHQARVGARSAVDRVLVVIGAAIGIVLANEGDLINRGVAFSVLGLTAALAVGALLLAFCLDLPGAESYVLMFRSDLEFRTEVLMPGDIESIKCLPSLQDGLRDVTRARRTCTAIASVAVISIVIAAVLIGLNSRQSTTESTPTTTSSSTISLSASALRTQSS